MTAFLTVKELASRWAVSEGIVRRAYLDNRALPYVKVGRAVRFKMADVLAYEDAHTQGGNTP